MQRWFDAHLDGPGVWKWVHYFDVYDRHLARFRGTDVHFLEIGIFSGGSLRMWRDYLGESATIYGVDISSRTRAYHDSEKHGRPKIFVGDQTSAVFWDTFKAAVPRVDVMIDDGGHTMPMQRATLEAMFDHLSFGGVYICEDLLGGDHQFWQVLFEKFVTAPAGLNRYGGHSRNRAWGQQRTVAELAIYPYMAVVEKLPSNRTEMIQVRHGTEWQPDRKFWYDMARSRTKVEKEGREVNAEPQRNLV